jgi:hypothetical protein
MRNAQWTVDWIRGRRMLAPGRLFIGSRPAAPRCPSGRADAQTCCDERQEHDERHLPDPDLLSDPGVSVMLALCGPRSYGEDMPTNCIDVLSLLQARPPP